MEKEMGRRIKSYMDAAGMSQAELAAAVGVGPTSVSNWVNGTKVPRMDKVDAMCRIFGCRRADLLDVPDHSVSRLAIQIEQLTPENREIVEATIRRLKAYQDALERLE